MVHHVLKDGSRPEDITGHIVKVEEAYTLYRFIDEVNQNGSKPKSIHKKQDEVRVC